MFVFDDFRQFGASANWNGFQHAQQFSKIKAAEASAASTVRYSLGSFALLAFALDAVQRAPQRAGRILSRDESAFLCFSVVGDNFVQFVAPDIRVINVSRRVQSEVATGFRVGSIHLAQSASLFFGDARNLRFVSVEGRERLGMGS
jgi:hypothetical protein